MMGLCPRASDVSALAPAGDFSPLSWGQPLRSASNTDQKGREAGGALIDWCTLVLPASVVKSPTDAALSGLLEHVFGSTGMVAGAVRDRMFNFYPQSCVLLAPDGQRAGDIGFGGNKDTICISLSGAGCRFVPDWWHVRIVAEQMGARLTRCDVAFDDVEGKIFDLSSLIALAKAGGFVSGGRPPETGSYDDHGTGKGRTLKVCGKGHK